VRRDLGVDEISKHTSTQTTKTLIDVLTKQEFLRLSTELNSSRAEVITLQREKEAMIKTIASLRGDNERLSEVHHSPARCD